MATGPSALITGSTRGLGLRIARTLAGIPNMNIMLHSNHVATASSSTSSTANNNQRQNNSQTTTQHNNTVGDESNAKHLSDAGYTAFASKEAAIESAMDSVRQCFRRGPGGGPGMMAGGGSAGGVNVFSGGGGGGEQRVLHTTADLSLPNEAAGAVNAAMGAFGRLDILINCAAILPEEFSTEFTPDEVWDRVLAVNLNAPFHCIKAALPGMKRRKFGRIINIGCSPGSPIPAPNHAAFVTAKQGMLGLSKAVALEVATVEGGNITCNTVTPGLVSGSGMFHQKATDRVEREGLTLASAEEAIVMECCPNGRPVSPEEVAAACAYLAMPANSSTNGANLVIDSGWSAQ